MLGLLKDRHLLLAAMVCGAFNGLMSPATGEDRDDRPLIASGQLLGATFTDSDGEHLGTLNRVAIGNQGRLAYAIVNIGGVLSISGHEVAIPFAAIRLKPSADANDDNSAWLATNVSLDFVKRAPALEARDYLELSDAAWVQKNLQFFGVHDAPDGPLAPLLFVDDLIDIKVSGVNDSPIAVLDDIIFELSPRPLRYAILGYGGALGIGKQYVAIPWSELDVVVGPQAVEPRIAIKSGMTAEAVEQKQRVTPDEYPELKLQSVRKRIADAP